MGDVHEFNHGGGQFWCECHALDAQIVHAEERVKALAELHEKRRTACFRYYETGGSEAASPEKLSSVSASTLAAEDVTREGAERGRDNFRHSGLGAEAREDAYGA